MKNRDGTKILIIGNNEGLINSLSITLKKKNFSLTCSKQSIFALKESLTNKYQVIIIEMGEKRRENIFEGISFFRKTGLSTPMILVYKHLTPEEEIEAYKYGIDIFHKKPIKPKLLEAQVEKVLNDKYIVNDIKISNLHVKPKERKLFLDTEEICLTITEYNFLLLLIKNNGIVLSRDQIIRNVMNYNRDVSSCAVDTMVSRIRKKLGNQGKSVIETVPGCGYRLGSEYTTIKKE